MPASAPTEAADKEVFTDRKVLLKRRARSINSTQFVSKAQCDDALRIFTELSELDAADVSAHTGRGDCLRMLNDAMGAFDCYMAALAIDSQHSLGFLPQRQPHGGYLPPSGPNCLGQFQ